MYTEGIIVEARIPGTDQWFPAVICYVETNSESRELKLLLEYENKKMGKSLVHPKDVRVCSDFEWYV